MLDTELAGASGRFWGTRVRAKWLGLCAGEAYGRVALRDVGARDIAPGLAR